MRTYTQISSGGQISTKITELTDKLTQLDIHTLVVQPPAPDTPWQNYSTELSLYRSIAKSSFHILYNDVPLTSSLILQVMYAMFKERPIIMIGRPSFSETVDPFLQESLEKHSPQFHSVNLLKLEFAELSFLFNKLKTSIDYKLSEEEQLAIVTKLREHLYDMVGQGLSEINSPLS